MPQAMQSPLRALPVIGREITASAYTQNLLQRESVARLAFCSVDTGSGAIFVVPSDRRDDSGTSILHR
jgi:hypothetical protein